MRLLHHSTRVALAVALALITMLVHATVASAQGSVVAMYPFEGNANDLSGNGHHGTVNGPTLVSDRFGRQNRAYAFDGDDWIEVPHSPNLNFGSRSVFTINAWVKACVDQDEYAGIVAKGPTNTFIPGYQLVVRDGLPEGLISQNDENFVGVLGTTRILDSTWHMLTLIVNAPTGETMIYVDGELNRTSIGRGVDPSVRNTANLFIGKERNSSRFARGAIDDVTIFDFALPETTIRELFVEGGWPFDAGNGSLSIDTPDGTSLCPGGSVRLIASGSLRYTWTPATGLSNPNIANPVASPTVTTTYTVTGVREDFPCGTVTSAQVTITVGDPKVELGPDLTICSGSSVVIGAEASRGSPPYRYSWTPATGLNDPGIARPTATPAATTRYIVAVTDALGCTGRDTIQVTVVDGTDVGIAIRGETDFGSLLPGSVVEKAQYVVNTGRLAARIDSITTQPPFTIVSVSPPAPVLLQPGDSITVRTRYTARPGRDSVDLEVHVGQPCDGTRRGPLVAASEEDHYCRIYIPDDSARVAEYVIIRLMIDSSAGLKSAGAYDFRATIAFDRTLLYPDPEFDMAHDDSVRRVFITGTRRDNSDLLADIPMTAMLGRVDTTDLVIESFEWIAPLAPVNITTVDGVFHLIDNCPEGGERRFLRGGQVTLRAIMPNPMSDRALVEFETSELGSTRLVVVDGRGRLVMVPFDASPPPGVHSLELDVSSLPAGTYFILLQTPTVIASQPLEVVR